MKTIRMNGILFADMIRGGAAVLSANRQRVNDLNVFPIPDGDTGDNMFMTINSGVAALAHEHIPSLGQAASTAAQGMLLGARGNSGVILSRIFAGISHELEGAEEADVVLLGKAFESGIDEAYRAVSVPVEGTMLTVYKDAVHFAGSQIKRDATLESYFDNFLMELRCSLQRTPELLDVLREAGVVDSGGAGMIYIAEGMQHVLAGENVTLQTENPFERKTDLSAFDENSVLTFGYCTEFLLRLQRVKTDLEHFDLEAFKSHLEQMGDSIVAFREGTIVKVHIHTKQPGDVLNYCQQFGEFLTTKIENMSLQHNGLSTPHHYAPSMSRPHKPYGLVSVATGRGIKEIFSALGCDAVVDGGQSMNPSAEDLLCAFRKINADHILVYPNNSNIIMTAQQAASLYQDAFVYIIPSRTIGEGYAAISMLDTDKEDVREILREQKAIIAGVVTGLVSQAVRDTEQNGLSIRKDDYIAFSGDEIYHVSENRITALLALADTLHLPDYDIALLICGENVAADEAQAAYDRLHERYPRAEIIMIDGQQPIYDYILTLE